MRIKINDKIYRLKEIESGVDSLMELVEEPKFKDGDFIYEDERIMIVKSCPNMYHAIMWHTLSYIPFYNGIYAVDFSEPTFRYATEEEKQILIDAMAKDGKRWNAEKKCVEDIPVRKFQKGDKVWIKDGISSKTHSHSSCSFTEDMDKYMDKGNVCYLRYITVIDGKNTSLIDGGSYDSVYEPCVYIRHLAGLNGFKYNGIIEE